MVVCGVLQSRSSHRVVCAVRGESLASRQGEVGSANIPTVETEHEFVKKSVGVSLIDEALTPSTVSQFAISLGEALKVERRTQRQQTSFMFHIGHHRWLCQIPTRQADRITALSTP